MDLGKWWRRPRQPCGRCRKGRASGETGAHPLHLPALAMASMQYRRCPPNGLPRGRPARAPTRARMPRPTLLGGVGSSRESDMHRKRNVRNTRPSRKTSQIASARLRPACMQRHTSTHAHTRAPSLVYFGHTWEILTIHRLQDQEDEEFPKRGSFEHPLENGGAQASHLQVHPLLWLC